MAKPVYTSRIWDRKNWFIMNRVVFDRDIIEFCMNQNAVEISSLLQLKVW